MCLLIYKPSNTSIPFEHIQTAMEQNDDGAGFALQVPGQDTLFMDKGLWSAKEFYDRFTDALSYYGNSSAMVHFRWSTGGLRNDINCHPFTLEPTPLVRGITRYALAHNGVLSSIAPCEHYSDTWYLSRQLSRFWSPKTMKRVLRKHVGPSNKFVLLTPTKAHIVGEQYGHWLNGVWYSNNSYKETVYRRYFYTPKGAWSWDDNDEQACCFLTDTPDCIYCGGKQIARYRVGNMEDVTLCWECKKEYQADMELAGCIDSKKVYCSFCKSMVGDEIPHWCDSILSNVSGDHKPPMQTLGAVPPLIPLD